MIGRDAASAGTAPHTIPVRPESSSANARTRRSIAKSSGSGSAPARRRRRRERLEQGPGEGHAGEAADQRQQHALGQELLQQPAAARAQRQAHRQLAPASPPLGTAAGWRCWRTRSAARCRPRRPAAAPPSAAAAAGRGPGRPSDRRVTRGGVAPGGSFTRVRKNSAEHGIELGARALGRDVRPSGGRRRRASCWSRAGAGRGSVRRSSAPAAAARSPASSSARRVCRTLPSCGPGNPAGATPTIVKTWPFRRISRPTTSGRPPKRVCQKS